MKYPLVYIEWEDHVGYHAGWENFKNVDNKPVLIASIGFLIREDEKCVSLCACLDTQGEATVGKNISTILKNCIKKRRRITL